jgi:hypothetical protein
LLSNLVIWLNSLRYSYIKWVDYKNNREFFDNLIENSRFFVTFDTRPRFVICGTIYNDGIIKGTVIQNPYQMGYISVKKALSAIKGENIEKRIDTGVTYVNKSNINTTDVNKILHPLTSK